MHGLKGRVDALDHFVCGYAEVFQTEGYVLAHHGGDKLVIGILKDHTRVLAHIPDVVLVLGVQPADQQLAARGNIKGVEQLGKGGFAGAVVPQHGDELAGGHGNR